MMKLFIYKVMCAAMVLGMFSCSSDFLKEYSQDLSRVQNVDDLSELLTGECLLPLGYYRTSGSNIYKGNENYAILHFMSDELTENTDLDDDPDYGFRDQMFPYFTWQKDVYLNYKGQNTNESYEDGLWTLGYEKISGCSMVLAAADDVNVSSEQEKSQLVRVKGEAHFLRAFYYLNLVNLYAKPYSPKTAASDLAIPLKITPEVEDKEFDRASVADVYAQIVQDLNEAEALLASTSPLSIYHPGIDAVYVLRSRVALYMQDWETASIYAKKAMEHDGYLFDLASLPSDSYPLSKSNKEVLFANGSSCFGNIVFPNPGRYSDYSTKYAPVWYASDDLYNLYQDNDLRKTTYLTTTDDMYNHKPTYHKIDNSRASMSSGVMKEVSDVFCIRTAEAYLNLAEAQAELEHDNEACEILGQLRKSRIEGDANVALSGADLMQFIRDERERELCFEGHRWFDLRRYTVDEKYPYSKEIVHTYTLFSNGANYYYGPVKVNSYRLEKNDAAYVLDIPKTERDFQLSLGSNERPVRNIIESTDVEVPDDEY